MPWMQLAELPGSLQHDSSKIMIEIYFILTFKCDLNNPVDF